MAVDSSNSKKNTISRMQQYCATILDTMAAAMLLRQEAIDAGYNAGGTDPLTDAFLNGGANPPFPQLDLASITAALAAINNIDVALKLTARTDYKALERFRP